MDYKAEIARVLSEFLPYEEAYSLLVPPKDIALGDICMPCFRLAKAWRKSPVAIAEELAGKIQKPPFVEEIKAVAGYLNFRYSSSNFASEVIGKVLEKGADYGRSDKGQGQAVCIDYSSINIAKPFHIGHLSTTVLGAALYRLYRVLGYNAVGINHLGDWGTQFGKLIVAYHKWSNREDIERGGVRRLVEIYVKFHQEAELHPELDDEARDWFRRLEEGDSEAYALWQWFKEITLKDDLPIYERLGVLFDSFAGESFYNDKMQAVIDELEEKNLLVDSEGARIVELEGMAPCIIVKRDGATLYATRDLAAAFYRKQHYDFVKCLYVVAYQQNLHFKQWFSVVDRMGYDWAKQLEHVAFGMVSLEEGAMSTRKGNAVWLVDVLDKAVEKALAIIHEKSPHLANATDVAEMVGVGSVIFSALINNRIKDIEFKYDKILNFDGETCPYVQYTHARCLSVLGKAGEVDLSGADYSSLSDDVSKDIVRSLERYPALLLEAADKNEPSFITRHVVELAKLYNKFYFDNKILSAPDGVREARLALTRAVATVIENGFAIIGIRLPDQM